jgi:hypothetical protein
MNRANLYIYKYRGVGGLLVGSPIEKCLHDMGAIEVHEDEFDEVRGKLGYNVVGLWIGELFVGDLRAKGTRI